MNRRRAILLLSAALAACSGIPLRSVPRLMRLQGAILEMDPAEFMLAIQLDARMAPPPGAVPVMEIAIKPARVGAFEPVERELPMRSTQSTAGLLNLATAPAGRRWLFYSFPESSQAELRNIQARFKKLRAEGSSTGASTGGGSVTLGIRQDGLAVRDPAFADTEWQSWLQTARSEGFFEIWTGTVASLLKRASRDG